MSLGTFICPDGGVCFFLASKCSTNDLDNDLTFCHQCVVRTPPPLASTVSFLRCRFGLFGMTAHACSSSTSSSSSSPLQNRHADNGDDVGDDGDGDGYLQRRS